MSKNRNKRNTKAFRKSARVGARTGYRVAPRKSAEEKAKENIMTTQPVGRAPKKPTLPPSKTGRIKNQGPRNIPGQPVQLQPIKGGRPTPPVLPTLKQTPIKGGLQQGPIETPVLPAGQTTGINPNPMAGIPATQRPIDRGIVPPRTGPTTGV